MLEVKGFDFGPFGTNTYVVSINTSLSGKAAAQSIIIVDPACSNAYEQQVLERYIQSITTDQSSVAIIATHGHLDHLWGAKWATEKWHTPVLMHEADIPMAKAMQQQYDLFGIRATAEDFEIAPVSNLKSQISNMSILSTPGHTPGSLCFYWPEGKVLLSGDTLFRMGYGRTDLPGGNMGQLVDSLERLFALPADVKVYPGHGEYTTIGAEKR